MTTYYIDYTATYDGDGTTAAQAAGNGLTGAWNRISGNTLVAGDIIWARRHNDATKTETSIITLYDDVEIIGWPLANDLNYDDRPASGTSAGWDADIPTHCRVSFNGASHYFKSITTGCTTMKMSRLEIFNDASGNTTSGTCLFMDPDDRRCEFYNVRFLSEILATATSSSPITMGGWYHKFILCHFEGQQTNTASYFIINSLLFRSLFIGCSFKIGNGYNMFSNTVGYNLFIDTTVEMEHNYSGSLYTNIVYSNSKFAEFRNFAITYVSGTNFRLSSGSYMYGVTGPNLELKLDTSGEAIVYDSNIKLIDMSWEHTHAYLSNCEIDAYAVVSWNATTGTNLLTEINCTNIGITGKSGMLAGGSRYISHDNDNVTGKFITYGKGMEGISSGLGRVTGSSWSIHAKLSGAIDFLGEDKKQTSVIIADLASGTHTITMYAMHALFNEDLRKRHFWFDLNWEDASFDSQIEVGHSGKVVDADASVWDDPNPYTAFKQAVTITLPHAQRVKIYVYTDFPNDAGYVNIDPNLVIT